MKNTLICFLSVLLINVAVAQTETTTPSTPGEMSDGTGLTSSITEDDYKALVIKLEQRAEKVKSKYFLEKEVFNSYNSTYSTTTVAVKSKIYRAGQVLLDDQNNELNQIPEENFQSRYVTLKKIDAIYDRLMYFSKQENTRPTEKLLKKLKEPSEISEVFFREE